MLIMRVMSQNSESPDIVALLQDIMQKQRQGEIIDEEDIQMTGEITKEMFKKLLSLVETIEKDNEDKRAQITILEQKLEKLADY